MYVYIYACLGGQKTEWKKKKKKFRVSKFQFVSILFSRPRNLVRNVRKGCKGSWKKKSAFVKGIQRETNEEGVCLSAYQG